MSTHAIPECVCVCVCGGGKCPFIPFFIVGGVGVGGGGGGANVRGGLCPYTPLGILNLSRYR